MKSNLIQTLRDSSLYLYFCLSVFLNHKQCLVDAKLSIYFQVICLIIKYLHNNIKIYRVVYGGLVIFTLS